jgi:hypothetical protein
MEALKVIKKLILFMMLLELISCGVKGKPQVPSKAPFIGRGLVGSPLPEKDDKREF